MPQLRLITLRPGAGGSQRALASRLRRDPRVARVEVEHRATPRALPNDPALIQPAQLAGLPPGTPEEWWASAAGLIGAWDQVAATGIPVAVIDGGVDATHPDLTGRIAGSVSEDAGGGPALQDDVGHGTHVASLACATSGNGLGIAGAGDGCRLLVARTDFTDASVAASIVWAADHRARAIVMSFGTDDPGPAPQPILDALRYAVRRGAVPVAAAADAPVEDQGYPADVLQPAGTGSDPTSDLGLSVTASTFAGQSRELRRARQRDLARGARHDGRRRAPGGSARRLPGRHSRAWRPASSTVAAGARAAAAPRSTATSAGPTSRAPRWPRRSSPGRLRSCVRRTRICRSPTSSRLLKQTAARPAGTSWTPELGWGVLDAGAAVRAARRLDRTPPTSHLTITPAGVGGRSRLLRWTGRDAAGAGLTASGVARWEIWRATAGAPARRIARLPAARHRLRVRLARGSRYRFFSIAVDRAGNREAPPPRGDASVRVR